MTGQQYLTRVCALELHELCAGEAVATLRLARAAVVLPVDCGCLCHAGSVTDEALEQLLEQGGPRD